MPPASASDPPEIGRDALDTAAPPGRSFRGWRALPSRRAALGLGDSAMPSIGFVLAGYLLGPQLLGVVSLQAAAYLDSVVSVALAMLGVFVGLGLGGLQERTTQWTLLAATIETLVTAAVVAAAMYALFGSWGYEPPTGRAMFAVLLGICSAASAAVAVRAAARREEIVAARIADLDDVPLIGLGAICVGIVGAGFSPAAHVLVTLAAGAAIGVAGWLLFERVRGEAERAVFVTGAVVLLGGVAAFLNGSPLLAGCAAAFVWARAPGGADRVIQEDLRRLQHPLVALLLVVAGLSFEPAPVLLWIAAPLVLVRLTGKLLASAAAARMTGAPAGLIATVLVPPGVIGVALALNLQQALGSGDTLLVSAIALATVASEIIGAVLPAGDETEGPWAG